LKRNKLLAADHNPTVSFASENDFKIKLAWGQFNTVSSDVATEKATFDMNLTARIPKASF